MIRHLYRPSVKSEDVTLSAFRLTPGALYVIPPDGPIWYSYRLISARLFTVHC
jgi:hypothetical protein